MRNQLLFLAFVLFLACLAVASPTRAQTFTGDNGVAVAVPKDWTAEYEAPNMQILLASPLEDCAASIQLMPNSGKNAKEFGKTFSRQMNGTSPEKLDNGCYVFDAFFQGLPLTATVCATNNHAAVLLELGNVDGYPAELRLIRSSLHSNDPEAQELLNIFK